MPVRTMLVPPSLRGSPARDHLAQGRSVPNSPSPAAQVMFRCPPLAIEDARSLRSTDDILGIRIEQREPPP